MTTLNIVAFIIVPCVIFLLGVIGVSVKGIIRFAQYLAHTEEALDKIATSNAEIRNEVRGYKTETDIKFDQVDEKVHGIDRRLYSVERVLGQL